MTNANTPKKTPQDNNSNKQRILGLLIKSDITNLSLLQHPQNLISKTSRVGTVSSILETGNWNKEKPSHTISVRQALLLSVDALLSIATQGAQVPNIQMGEILS